MCIRDRYGRRAVALRVSIAAINSLNKDELQRLDRKLMEIVSEDKMCIRDRDYVPHLHYAYI